MRIRARHYKGLPGAAYALGLVLALALAPASALAAPTISEFPTAPGSGPEAVTAGADGNLWFVETGGDRIGRMTPAGVVTYFSAGLTSTPDIAGITAGPDGNVWFTERDEDQIGRITPSGTITEFTSGIDGGSDPQDITTGPDGNLWFTENGHEEIGRITPSGTITEFPIPGSNNNAYGITAGPDGNVWFTEHTAGSGGIGRITPSGTVTEFPGTTGLTTAIATGPDGNLWFVDNENPGSIGRILPGAPNTITQFSAGLTLNAAPRDIAVGADGNLYFTENAGGGRIGQITPSGVITGFSTGLTAAPWGITSGPDGNIWFTERAGNRLGRLTLVPGAATDPATGIAATNATLAGTVTPRAQATNYVFEWGLTTAYGSSTTTTGAGSGTAALPVTAVISGLAPSTTYHFRVVATNPTGTKAGADRAFTTLAAAPDVTTAAATAVDETSATLNAIANPNGAATTYHFDVGLTSGYGDRLPAADAPVAPSSVPLALQQPLSGLVPGTSYHYRVVATNASGITYGADQSFTTVAPAPFAIPVALPATTVLPPVLPPATRPVLGRSAKISATAGEVLVELPGTGVFIPLSAASTVPVGTTIDATRGTLKLTNVRDTSGKLQTGTFWGGSFTVRQTRGKKAATVLALAAPLACAKSRDLAAVAPGKRTRQLWGRDNNGRFVTRGRTAVATVRGTAWFTRDTCAGTLVKVTSGSVAVHDLVRDRTIIVHAGRSYLARVR